MDDTNSLIEQRKAKLAALRAKGIDPFMNKFTPTPDLGCGAAREKFEKGEFAEGQAVAIAGRISAHRDMGKSQFIDLKDVTGRVQVYAQKQALGDEQFEVFSHLDLADFIGVKGTMFRTRAGEISVKAESFTVLAKALRPPPDKWDGLADIEVRYRQRYLDLIASDEVKQTFLKRSAIIREIRAFFHERGYVEVETPMMQAIPGGAAAQPFKTHHNALGCEFFLRIALELYLKRLLVGGVDKVFEIGRNFRNEGLSRKHNPEFTMLEAYEAFGDYETMMETVESLVKRVAKAVIKSDRILHSRTSQIRETLRTHVLANNVLFAHVLVKESPNGNGSVHENYNREVTFLTEGPIRVEHVRVFELIRTADGPSSAEEAAKLAGTIAGRLEEIVNSSNWNQSNTSLANSIISDLREAQRKLRRLSNFRVINLAKVWRRRSYRDLVRTIVRFKTRRLSDDLVTDWFSLSPTRMREIATDKLGLDGEFPEDCETFEITNAVFGKLVEPLLVNPTFVTHLPKELVPLAKLSPDDPTTVEVFECCINGQEISPGYTEQNDPIAQRETLEHQAGGEQQKLDEDFIVALEHGMPPAGGIGIGIDRLCMMLLGQESIRDVILFPQLKPKS